MHWLVIFLYPLFIHCEPAKEGNFSLPMSQQPSALVGFGGNIVNKGEWQFFLFSDAFYGKDRVITDVIPSALYGINDHCSVYFNFPFTSYMKSYKNHSCGLEDFYAQVEYAYYSHSTNNYSDQATVVANVTAPTGSVRKKPQTGFGSPTFFYGGTFYRTYVDWIFFTSQGAQLTTSRHSTQLGNQILYQFGFGKNIASPKGWIFAWLVELNGQYYGKNRLHNRIDPNSGGNAVYVTPSLWFSSKEWIVQLGFSVPIAQYWHGRQGKVAFAFNFNLVYSLY